MLAESKSGFESHETRVQTIVSHCVGGRNWTNVVYSALNHRPPVPEGCFQILLSLYRLGYGSMSALVSMIKESGDHVFGSGSALNWINDLDYFTLLCCVLLNMNQSDCT